MQKDFITVTPDNGSSGTTVTVVASENTGSTRSSSITISSGGMTRVIRVNQQEAEKELVDGTYYGEAYDYNILFASFPLQEGKEASPKEPGMVSTKLGAFTVFGGAYSKTSQSKAARLRYDVERQVLACIDVQPTAENIEGFRDFSVRIDFHTLVTVMLQ